MLQTYTLEFLETIPPNSLYTHKELLENESKRKLIDGNIWKSPLELTTDEIKGLRDGFDKSKEWKLYVQDFLPHLNMVEEYRIKAEENKKGRTLICGIACRFRYRKDGTFWRGTFFCGRCDKCNGWEGKQVKDQLTVVLADEGLRRIVVTEVEVKKVKRALREKHGLGEQSWQDIVSENKDGEVTHELFVKTTDKSIGEDYTLREHLDRDNLEFYQTPIGKRSRGKLVERKKLMIVEAVEEENIVDRGDLQTTEYIINFDKLPEGFRRQIDVIEALDDLAVSQTSDTIPQTIKEVQTVINLRNQIISEAVRKLSEKLEGVTYSVLKRQTSTDYITKDDIQTWQENNEKPRKHRWKELRLDV